MKTMPDEMTIREKNGSTLEIYNDRGSFRICDVIIERTEHLLQFDLNAISGALDIKAGETTYKLSSYQVKALIEFLHQKD